MTFYEIEFPLADLSVESVETALEELGAGSITFVDRGDEPVLEPKPGEFRLWSDTLVRALFQAPASSEAADAARKLATLVSVLGPHVTNTARVRAVKDQDWERVWLTDWKSLRFGRRLWVCPTAAEPPDDPDAVVVRLDPGLAFGTGTHPTTALCLQILDALPLSGRSVIDYGCGSGILGIAALKMGAAHVIAVDLDPQALLATRDNATLLATCGPRNPYPDGLGVVEEGALADLLLIDGNPLADLRLLEDHARNIVVIMKDGVVYKDATAPEGAL